MAKKKKLRVEMKDCRCTEERELPMLVLAVHRKYDFLNPYRFEYLAHQTAGHACNHHYMAALSLKPKDEEIRIKMDLLAGYWLETDAGLFYPNLDEINKYRAQIRTLFGIDCNHSYRDFEEGIFPIDCTKENIAKLTDEELPESLDDLIKWKSSLERCLGCVGRWNLYILGPNCD